MVRGHRMTDLESFFWTLDESPVWSDEEIRKVIKEVKDGKAQETAQDGITSTHQKQSEGRI